MHPFTYIAAALFLTGWAVYSLIVRLSKKTNNGLEPLPGPRLVPFIGRIHDLPIQYMWLKFKEWADVYGPIYYTEMLGAKFIVVADETIAEELLVKRAKYNSDRPQIRSLFDSKSSDGSMEYLPLMGKNGKHLIKDVWMNRLTLPQNIGPANVAFLMPTLWRPTTPLTTD